MEKNQATVLVVEDEEPILTMLKYNLEQENFKVLTAMDGEEALLQVREYKPDIVVLDWMLPSMSGVEVCKSLRRDANLKNIPIIMLSARGEEADRVQGLDSGADDYLTKPFSPSELVARIRAVFRRIRPAFSQEKLEFENVVMDLSTHRVTRKNEDIHLGPTEFRLLRYLMEHPGRVFSRESLLDAVWGQDIYVEIRTVDVHIRRLRKALNYDDKQAELVRTVRAAGYSLEIIPFGEVQDDAEG